MSDKSKQRSEYSESTRISSSVKLPEWNAQQLNLLKYIDRNVEVKIREFQGDEWRLNLPIQIGDLVHKCF
ncbi:11035_t:CDS:2 [Funneliformis caledonium]|uniref:11035_t:CDS:1 n=1 Tax=Funneliformis caledonium TaxID=1117310 RepID=A0A9N9HDN9_9GLOM|nr:11035_t:CDS:2 [Funneliformis caledonium]